MSEKEINVLSRRKFLQLAATVASGTVLTTAGVVLLRNRKSQNQQLNVVWYLNPAFRVNELSTDKLELFTHLSDGRELKHAFEGLEADVLRLIADESKMAGQIEILARKHSLTTETCHKQVSKAIAEFNKARLIYTGEKMLVKVVGA